MPYSLTLYVLHARSCIMRICEEEPVIGLGKDFDEDKYINKRKKDNDNNDNKENKI